MEAVFIIAPIAILAWGVWTYNRLIRMRNQVNEAWAGIDVQLPHRPDPRQAPVAAASPAVAAGSFLQLIKNDLLYIFIYCK